MLKTIKLYGVLGKKFGKEFKLAVESTREAVKALSVQVPGFEQFMLNAHEQGLAFAIFQDDENISEDQIDFDTGAKVIKIVPKVMGAGGNGGVLQLVLGAVLIVAGFWTGGVTSNLGVALIGAGAGMVVGGIAQMLTPKADAQDQNQDGNRANKSFGGAVTTIAQGNPVPILYGQREVGGFIVNAGQFAVDTFSSADAGYTGGGSSGGKK
ncbi:tail assembly protein [Acinetobacter bereziniae]|jgi:predicted phage tail protein|uniref:tail assembly protein n=1 Tax=Acinetobacter TaxID=469 RepID=UPI00124E68AB|nr:MULTISPECIES: tail assembly protein [Acinetobacter]MCU4434712.1 tail assembly protein [Acinetobacter bereziniae]MDQ9818432.1 tail assembly protein [Acinetobacter bereziniae]MDR6543002.1 putative phage tail protein [Acinetobacter bereziniae]BCX73951.1 phage tail assembly protein [Acinetobacter sp. Tol 5]